MTRLRLAVLALATVAACTFGAGRALADPTPSCNPAPTMPQTISSPHFEVHYTDDPNNAGYISETQAGNVLAAAERAYATYTADGFPAPAVALSGKTEFFVMDLSPWKLGSIECFGGGFDDA